VSRLIFVPSFSVGDFNERRLPKDADQAVIARRLLLARPFLGVVVGVSGAAYTGCEPS